MLVSLSEAHGSLLYVRVQCCMEDRTIMKTERLLVGIALINIIILNTLKVYIQTCAYEK